MILDIVPGDIISPFQTGNAMQIIFMAICVGMGGLILRDSMTETVMIANQINSLVQLLMEWISKILPLYVFLSLANLIISSNLQEIARIMLPFVLIVAACLVVPVLYGLYTSLKVGMPFKELVRSQLPSYLVALTTASSAAAFSSNVECCEKKLHIDPKLVRFGIPFGQVLFMPDSVFLFMILSLFMAKQYGVPMTPAWFVSLIVVTAVLAAATPPIPGGTLTSAVFLFTQLGIPASAVALCAAVMTFSDYVGTACNIACLQQELLLTAKKLEL